MKGMRAGFYVTTALAADVVRDWTYAGWVPAVVDLDAAELRPGGRVLVRALAAVSDALSLPRADEASSLATSLRSVPGGTVLVWPGGSEFADAHPAAWSRVADALAARVAVQPPMAVVLAAAPRAPRD